MIKSFAHKGLEQFFLTGNTSGIQFAHRKKLKLVLDLLDAALSPEDVNFPGSGLHKLLGDKQGLWSVKISGNWRVTFSMTDGDVYIVNYLDYH